MAAPHPEKDLVKEKLSQIPVENTDNGAQFYINLLEICPDLKSAFEGKVDKEGFEKMGNDFIKFINHMAGIIREEGQLKEAVSKFSQDLKEKGITFEHLQKTPQAFFKLLREKGGGLNEDEEKAFNEFFKLFISSAQSTTYA